MLPPHEISPIKTYCGSRMTARKDEQQTAVVGGRGTGRQEGSSPSASQQGFAKRILFILFDGRERPAARVI